MVDPEKLFPASSLITMQNLVAVFHIVWVYAEGPQNSGGLGMGIAYDHVASPPCVSMRNSVAVGRTVCTEIWISKTCIDAERLRMRGS